MGLRAGEEEQIDPAVIRTDTTVVETNIHWPTDSSLLWDTWRVASRLLKRGREIAPETCPHRFHDQKIKRLHLFITRYAKSPSKKRQRKVKGRVSDVDRAGGVDRGDRDAFCCSWAPCCRATGAGCGGGRAEGLPAGDEEGGRRRRGGRQLEGETVPAAERVFSIFEPHTELIKRGRREKPVEFGHMRAVVPDGREVHHRLRGVRRASGRLHV